MTDQTIPADKLREIYDMYRNGDCNLHDAFRDAIALIPPKPLPTLADMTEEEREKCQWMQADHLNEARGIITLTDPVVVLFEDGRYMAPCPLSHVTPRPDLPKMVWPGSEPDVSKSAPEIDTSTRRADPIDMSPEPQPGEAWRAVWNHYGRTVTAIKRTDGNWWAIDGDEEPHVVARTGITPVTRLVPETRPGGEEWIEAANQASKESLEDRGFTFDEAQVPGLRFAEHDVYGLIALAPNDDDDETVLGFIPSDLTGWGAHTAIIDWAQHEMVEVKMAPETPRKTLVTEEDYRDAPVGTVITYPAFFDDGVEDDWIDTAVKYGDGHWRSTGSVGYDDNHGLAGAARTVIWEPEA